MTQSPSPKIYLPKTLIWMRCLDFPHKLGVMDRLFGHSLKQQPVGWASVYPGWLWKLDPANTTHRWMIYGDYQGPALWRWLRQKGESINRIVDSGANIGQTIAYFSQICPQATIYAYEPGHEARKWLEECLTINNISQVHLSSKGLSNKPGRARLQADGPLESHGSWNSIHSDTSGEIELSTLDQEFSTNTQDIIDFWKIDVEGFEWEVLQGAMTLFNDKKIRSLYVEAGISNIVRICDYLGDKGFTGWVERGDSFVCLKSVPSKEGNFLFVHQDSPLLSL